MNVLNTYILKMKSAFCRKVYKSYALGIHPVTLETPAAFGSGPLGVKIFP